MSHFTRRIIFWSFFVIFIILTLYFSLLMNGYVISFSNLRDFPNFDLLQKTGILTVNSSPRGANIYLNKNFTNFIIPADVFKNEEIQTPNKIKNLAPGEYDLRVELDGYWPFEQKVTIHPGRTTYLENIDLFKKSLPILIYSSDVQNVSISEDYSNIILKESNVVFNVKNETIFFDDRFFSQDKGGVLNNYKDVLDIETVESYFLGNHYLFVIKENNNKKYLNIYFNRDRRLIREIEMPANNNFEIYSFNGRFLMVKDLDFHNLHIINPFSRVNIFRDVLLNVKNISLVSNSNFIYSNNFEIYFYDFNSLQSSLVSRFQNEIRSLVWHPREYIVFSDNNSINIIDLKHEKRFTNLFSFEHISNIVLDRENGIVYFTAQIGNQRGLYKLLIQ